MKDSTTYLPRGRLFGRGPIVFWIASALALLSVYAPPLSSAVTAEEVKVSPTSPQEPLDRARELNTGGVDTPSFHTALPRSLQWVGEGAWQPPKGEWYVGLWALRRLRAAVYALPGESMNFAYVLDEFPLSS